MNSVTRTFPILDQWKLEECSSFACIACLIRMRPELDPYKIIEEMRPDFPKLMTIVASLRWLMKRWYIKNYTRYRYNPLTVRNTPVVARIYRVNWIETGKHPYKLIIGEKNANAHYVCITDKGTVVNSWGKEWGDNWYFYFNEEQIGYFSFIFRMNV